MLFRSCWRRRAGSSIALAPASTYDWPKLLAGRTLLLRIPAGTQSGRQFRLRGHGLPRFKADGSGDLIVKTRVVLPGAGHFLQWERADLFNALVIAFFGDLRVAHGRSG